MGRHVLKNDQETFKELIKDAVNYELALTKFDSIVIAIDDVHMPAMRLGDNTMIQCREIYARGHAFFNFQILNMTQQTESHFTIVFCPIKYIDNQLYRDMVQEFYKRMALPFAIFNRTLYAVIDEFKDKDELIKRVRMLEQQNIFSYAEYGGLQGSPLDIFAMMFEDLTASKIIEQFKNQDCPVCQEIKVRV